jgi:hypothetical protein
MVISHMQQMPHSEVLANGGGGLRFSEGKNGAG